MTTHQEPAPTEALVDTLWLLDTLIQGETASTVLGDPATLLLRDAATFEGSTGCRTFSGRYQRFGAEIQFNEFGADGGDCPTELEPQDSLGFGVLGDGFTTEVDSARMTATASGGDALGYRAITEDELGE